MQKFKDLGFMKQDENSKTDFKSWSEFTNLVLKQSKNNIQQDDQGALEWLGLLDSKPNSLNFKNNFDGFCRILQDKLKYFENERDMAILFHEFIVYNPQKDTRKMIQVRLCEFGDEESSGMAKMVGIPVALAALKILEGEIVEKGVKVPVIPSIYKPILNSLPISFDIQIKNI